MKISVDLTQVETSANYTLELKLTDSSGASSTYPIKIVVTVPIAEEVEETEAEKEEAKKAAEEAKESEAQILFSADFSFSDPASL